MTPEEIKLLAQELSQLISPKEWLTRKDLMDEFGIKSTLVHELINDKQNPLPYTTFGDRKQLFNREDINKYLRGKMRNNFK